MTRGTDTQEARVRHEASARLRFLHVDELRRRREEIVAVYRAAFDASDERAEFFAEEQLGRHPGYAGFRFLATERDGSIAGFVYGYTSLPERWWHDTVAPSLRGAGHGEWLEDAFELVEIAVAPPLQGRGIGTRLIATMLEAVPHRRVLLSTGDAAENRARALYRRLGFVDLLPGFTYPGSDETAVIMGLDRGAATAPSTP